MKWVEELNLIIVSHLTLIALITILIAISFTRSLQSWSPISCLVESVEGTSSVRELQVGRLSERHQTWHWQCHWHLYYFHGHYSRHRQLSHSDWQYSPCDLHHSNCNAHHSQCHRHLSHSDRHHSTQPFHCARPLPYHWARTTITIPTDIVAIAPTHLIVAQFIIGRCGIIRSRPVHRL